MPISEKLLLLLSCILLIGISACQDDEMPMDDEQMGDLIDIPYDPQPFIFDIPPGFPSLPSAIADDTSIEGVNLGRHLFYDPILSDDLSMSCSSCHLPEGSFTDNEAVSIGIDGIAGKRSSMSILNLVYNENGFFWDGRSPNLEDQALLPVEDPIELHTSWTKVVDRFKEHDTYPELFRKAFGITDRSEITKELAAKALAQFEKSLISSGRSKWDRVQNGEAFFNDDELAGFNMFFDINNDLSREAECSHCHGGPLFTTNEYFNNGLQPADNLEDFEDLGRGAVTNDPLDNGKFRAPTLRNISFSAPYMHDGSLATLEEVIEHYFSGGHISPNIDPLLNDLRPRVFSEEQKMQLIAFLRTLDDPKYMENPDFQNPF